MTGNNRVKNMSRDSYWTTKPSKGGLLRKPTDVCNMLSLAIAQRGMGNCVCNVLPSHLHHMSMYR